MPGTGGGRWAAGWLAAAMTLAPLPAAATVITVGAGGSYATLADAVAAAAAGDTIDVAAGTYLNQTATIDKPLTIIGTGGLAVFDATRSLASGNDKGILVVNADATIENLVFENAVADPLSNNGAGIRYQQGNLTVRNSRFIGNQDGILATPSSKGSGTVTVENVLFQNNGIADGQVGSSYAHALYATDVQALIVTNSTFEGTLAGHDIKSRAANSLITNNMLYDGVTGTTSYAIDLSNGGNATVTGNTIVQGTGTDNPIMIAYDPEGLVWPGNTALIAGNTFINTEPGAIGVNNFAAARGDAGTQVTVACNTFSGVGEPVSGGPITSQGNVTGTTLPPCAVPAPPGLAVLVPALLLLVRRGRRIDAPCAAA